MNVENADRILQILPQAPATPSFDEVRAISTRIIPNERRDARKRIVNSLEGGTVFTVLDDEGNKMWAEVPRDSIPQSESISDHMRFALRVVEEIQQLGTPLSMTTVRPPISLETTP